MGLAVSEICALYKLSTLYRSPHLPQQRSSRGALREGHLGHRQACRVEYSLRLFWPKYIINLHPREKAIGCVSRLKAFLTFMFLCFYYTFDCLSDKKSFLVHKEDANQ
jgi:hypothetical protein